VNLARPALASLIFEKSMGTKQLPFVMWAPEMEVNQDADHRGIATPHRGEGILLEPHHQ
jgi:hypothetical protein